MTGRLLARCLAGRASLPLLAAVALGLTAALGGFAPG